MIFDAILADEQLGPEDRLLKVVDLIIDDLTTRKTSLLFPELWNLSNRDPFVKERMDDLYARSRVAFIQIVAEMRPDLTEQQRMDLIVFMQASMEGHTVFTGHNREFEKRTATIITIAQQSFLNLIQTYQPD